MTITHIKDLLPDERNARKHNPRNIGMIANALNDVGAARSIVIDENGAILAGNGTVEAAAQAGIERVQVVDVDGDTIVAVRRSGLTTEQKQRLAVYDNRTAELATWDAVSLGELSREIDLSDMFTSVELARVLTGDPQAANEADAEWNGMPEFDQEDQMPIFRLIVNFASVDAVEQFSRLVEQSITVAKGEQTKYIWYPRMPRNVLADLRFVSDDDETSDDAEA